MRQADGSGGATGGDDPRRPTTSRRLDPGSVSALEALFALEAAEPVRPRALPTVLPAAAPPAPAPPVARRGPDTSPLPPVPALPDEAAPAPLPQPPRPVGAAPAPAPVVPAPAPRHPVPGAAHVDDRWLASRVAARSAPRQRDAVFAGPRWHWLGLVLAATVLAGVAIALSSVPVPTTTDRVVGSAAVGTAVLALVCALRCARARVVVSDEGVSVRGFRTSRRRWSTVADVRVRRVAGGHAVELVLLDGHAQVLPLPVCRRLGRAQRVADDARARRSSAPRLV